MRLEENLDNVGKKLTVQAEMASGFQTSQQVEVGEASSVRKDLQGRGRFSPSSHHMDSLHMAGCRGQHHTVFTMVLSAV